MWAWAVLTLGSRSVLLATTTYLLPLATQPHATPPHGNALNRQTQSKNKAMMKTFLCAALAYLATLSSAQDFNPSGGGALGERCRSNDDCGRDMSCVNNVCEDDINSGGSGAVHPGGSGASIPAGDMCMPGQICEGGGECPSCFVEPCTCPELVVEAAVF
jgi:hypothetical protein